MLPGMSIDKISLEVNLALCTKKPKKYISLVQVILLQKITHILLEPVTIDKVTWGGSQSLHSWTPPHNPWKWKKGIHILKTNNPTKYPSLKTTYQKCNSSISKKTNIIKTLVPREKGLKLKSQIYSNKVVLPIELSTTGVFTVQFYYRKLKADQM